MSIPDGARKALEQVLERGPTRFDRRDRDNECEFCDRFAPHGREVNHDPDCPWEALAEWAKQQLAKQEVGQ